MTESSELRALLDEYYTYYVYLKDNQAPLEQLAKDTLLGKCVRVMDSHVCEDWYMPVHDQLYKFCQVQCDGREVEYAKVYDVKVYWDKVPITAFGKKCEALEESALGENRFHLADSLESFSEMATKRYTCLTNLERLVFSKEFDVMFYHDSMITRDNFFTDLEDVMRHRYEMSRNV